MYNGITINRLITKTMLQVFDLIKIYPIQDSENQVIYEYLKNKAVGMNTKLINILIQSIIENNQTIFNYLYDRNVDVNQSDDYNNTPLMVAAQYGNTEIAEKILKRDATIYGKELKLALKFAFNIESNQPLSDIDFDKRLECAKLLIRDGVDIEELSGARHYFIAKTLKNDIERCRKETKMNSEINNGEKETEKIMNSEINNDERETEKIMNSEINNDEKETKMNSEINNGEKEIETKMNSEINDEKEKIMNSEINNDEKETEKIMNSEINDNDKINNFVNKIYSKPTKKLERFLELFPGRLKKLTDIFVAAIIQDKQKIFDHLLEKNIDINSRDSCCNSTPIMFAAQFGRAKIIKKLLDKGANIDNDQTKSALHFCVYASQCDCSIQRKECAQLLIHAGAKCNYGIIVPNTQLEKYFYSIKYEDLTSDCQCFNCSTEMKNTINDENNGDDNDKLNKTGDTNDEIEINENSHINETDKPINENKDNINHKCDDTESISRKIDTFITTDGQTISIPTMISKKKIIKIVDYTSDTINYNLEKILGSAYVKINNENNEKKLLTVVDYCIEIPITSRIHWHCLPAGVMLDGEVTSENFFCRFDGIIVTDTGIIKSSEMYLD